ncbi:MAG: imidazole glycerol phosphate synthase, glutamine amidotransferase subunit [Candidatus Muproteobacteria bacterium RIFCSPHIGHO2_01_FULL_65_16]|uniref:Imidazole glycerol phosphate synthase subunit HisH n=1 Tax=Candidatus Muproteobacteria bacterium RIFCSPHIGHO2_01_FULL_65_16 TaxID=1817764 RepID=A0A1F6TNH2_9PROT|nr:MAG: imidazole glycerol phosphate synthase, glutamine amidotransferase subunit [Candidatus Muproteobacteria bacterium RIFCSPHIGHO2_01_FULL_65_16]
MTTVAVLDYGMGNLRSVCKALEHVAPKASVRLTARAEDIRRADRVVFPGQGAIGGCMTALERGGLRAPLLEALREKPFLGICLGLQALYEYSEEGGGTPCLNILRGTVRRFPAEKMLDAATGRPLKVPHMGWNQVRQEAAHPLWRGIPRDSRFYFVHSYYAESADPADAAGTTEYVIRFTAAAARANIFAVQFHPEKSQAAGLKLLENFVSWDGGA